MGSSIFIHLRVNTSYSFDSTIKIKSLAAKCAEMDMPAIGRADPNMFNMLEFSESLSKVGVQPIIGCDITIKLPATNPMATSEGKILLIAKNEDGYRNLMKLSTVTYDNNNGKPFASIENLSKFSLGIIALTGNYKTGILSIARSLSCEEKVLSELRDIYGDRSLFLEIQRHGYSQELEFEDFTYFMAKKFDVPVVATNQTLYLELEQHKSHDALLCIQHKTYVAARDRVRLLPTHHLRSSREMQELFKDREDAIENTELIARRCNYWPEKSPIKLPSKGKDYGKIMSDMAWSGLESKRETIELYSSHPFDEYEKRLEFELDLINKMGFAGYFLIVSGFIRWAKNNDIPVGPGRGSAAGSLVSWCLDVIGLDPLRFGLLFERFLNPNRISMPDIDVDICQDGRDRVIEYVRQTYGDKCVAHIITFGTLQTRAALRDVGRVLQIPYGYVDKICRMVPSSAVNPLSLSQVIEHDASMRKLYNQDSSVKEMIDISMELEGLYRHASLHAAGVVISDVEIDDIIPVCRDSKTGDLVTQYSMKFVEDSGMIKFDFLGLRTLTVINNAQKSAIKQYGEVARVDDKSFKDKDVFRLLSKGLSIGIFHLDGVLMQNALRSLKPDCIEDLIALLSLNRPGPIDNLGLYIKRKQGKAEIDYYHESLKSALKETFGIPVYQEQVMLITRIVAGYSLGAADILRRAMGKKEHEEMEKQRDCFIKGAIENGYTREIANSLFELIAKFAGYGFNKSHAAAYAVISYQTAWLKAKYLHHYLVAFMNSELNNADELIPVIYEARKMSVNIVSPDVNCSMTEFYLDGEAILYALGACKNVGEEASNVIVEERKRRGPYKSITDFASRMAAYLKVINKRALLSLAKVGAFDCIYDKRAHLINSIEKLMKYMRISSKNATVDVQQISLFQEIDYGNQESIFNIIPDNYVELSHQERLRNEFEVLGLLLTGNPLEHAKSELEHMGVVLASQISRKKNNDKIRLAGLIAGAQIKPGKVDKFAKLTILDSSRPFQCSIYDPGLIARYADVIKVGSIIVIEAKVLNRVDGSTLLIVDKIWRIDDERFSTNSLSRSEDLGHLNRIVIYVNEEVDVVALKMALKTNVPDDEKSNMYSNICLAITDSYGSIKMIQLPEGKYYMDYETVGQIRKMKGVIQIEK